MYDGWMGAVKGGYRRASGGRLCDFGDDDYDCVDAFFVWRSVAGVLGVLMGWWFLFLFLFCCGLPSEAGGVGRD